MFCQEANVDCKQENNLLFQIIWDRSLHFISVVCPEGYEFFEGITTKCYRYNEEELMWPNATHVCNQDGGELASIPDAATNEVLRGGVDKKSFVYHSALLKNEY